MTPVEKSLAEEEFSVLLSQYDEAKVAGKTVDFDWKSLNDFSPDFTVRLVRAFRAIDCLERFRQLDLNPFMDEMEGDSESKISGLRSETFRRIGRFEIVRELGRGGYGIVYLANDPALDRQIALKVPRPEILITPELKRRFLLEAKVAAGLNHPNLVVVYEAGEAGPICWIAEEYCAGTTLSTRLLDHTHWVSVRVAARLVAELADGVEHAHRRGVLHRDLKPGNVMLVSDPTKEAEPIGNKNTLVGITAKLTDFGLAKLTEVRGDETRAGTVLGTPSYMAPEQADPQRGGALSPSTDVYGLGTILYEMLAGRPPFRGVNDTDTLRQVLWDDPLPLSQLRHGLARDLEAICLRCLEKQPRQRYPSAGELAVDLRRFLAGEPTHARPLSQIQKTLRWSRCHPTAVAWLAMMVVSLAIMLVGGVWHVDRLNHELAINEQLRHEAEVRQQQQRHQQYRTDIQLGQRLWQEGKLVQTRQLLVHYIPVEGAEDLRNFAWHYLWQRCHQQLTTYQGHTGDVSAVVYSPDGQQIVTAGHDGMVRRFDTQSGRQLTLYQGHQGEVNCVAYTPDGQILATGADDGTVRLWDVGSARLLATLTGHKEDVLSLAISPDGAVLASGGIDKIVRLWSLEKYQLLHEFEGHTDWIRGLTFAPDGVTLASASDDRHVILWNLETAIELRRMVGKDWVLSVAFDPQGEWLAAGYKNRVVLLWNAETGTLLRAPLHHQDWVRGVAISGDGKYLAAVGNGHLIKLWSLEDISQPQTIGEIPGHTNKAWAVAFSPDSKTMVTAGGDGVAKRWRVGDSPYWDEYWQLPDDIVIQHLAISGDGATVAAVVNPIDASGGAIAEDELRLWDRGGRDGIIIHGDASTVEDIGWSADGRQLAYVYTDRYPQILQVDAPHEVRRLDRPSGADFSTVAFHPNGKILAVGNGTGTICLWNLPAEMSENVLLTSKKHASIYQLLFSPDGSLLAAYDGNQHVVFLYHLETRSIHASLLNCEGDMSFSSNGQLLATGARDRSILIWSVATGDVVRTLAGKDNSLDYLEFSPDGKILATIGQTGPATLWDVKSGEELLHIPTPFSRIRCLNFVSDGKSLMVGGTMNEADGGSGKIVSGVVFYSAGDPLLTGETFKYQIP
jgi:WD40 repeat protein/serine/threonine protein kinase